MAYVLELRPAGEVICRIHQHRGRRPAEFIGGLCVSRPSGQALAELAPEDRRLILGLAMCCQVRSDTGFFLAGTNGFRLAQQAVDTGRCFWDAHLSSPLKWKAARSVTAAWQPENISFYRPILIDEGTFDVLLPLSPPVYIQSGKGFCGPVQNGWPDGLLRAWASTPAMEPAACAAFVHRLSRQFPGFDLAPPREAQGETLPCVPPRNRIVILALPPRGPLRAGAADLAVRLEFDYQGRSVAWGDPSPSLLFVEQNRLKCIPRHREAEALAAGNLRARGLNPDAPAVPQAGAAPAPALLEPADDQAFDWSAFLSRDVPALRQAGWDVRFDGSKPVLAAADTDWYTSITAHATDWFDFEAGFRVDGRAVNLLPVIQALLARHRDLSLAELEKRLESSRSLVAPTIEGDAWVVVPAARIVTLLRHVFDLFGDAAMKEHATLRLSARRLAEIADLERWSASPWNVPEGARALAARLRNGPPAQPVASPAGLKATLRDYQRMGLTWLQWLREAGVDGVLADDMGLGKTVQVLAHLLAEKRAGRLRKPALIIAPTSLMSNWMSEIRRFTPGLKALLVHGADRHPNFARLGRADLILTSYALARLDLDAYRPLALAYLVLDEAHSIKNPDSKIAQAVCSLQSERRLCLSGTPMENHLGDLWSLFHFLMPGFLGPRRAFEQTFREPIERQGDDFRRSMLKRRVAPFILRRTKDIVARELPPKTEIVQPIALSARQAERYESVRLAMAGRIRDEIAARGLKRSSIVVLDALLKLRQICCDPRLNDAAGAYDIPADSAKLDALLEMLPELIEEGRRILLFSQFTGMLALIERELAALDIGYSLLTGSTRDRPAAIESFQSGQVPLFLISLKAGGMGLNLTAADTVIHYDPWWNPAAEAQATDRAHRIGQDKSVFVYKLITEGTIEAHILELQARKKQLVAGILDAAPADTFHFDQADLDRLFAPVAGGPTAHGEAHKRTRQGG